MFDKSKKGYQKVSIDDPDEPIIIAEGKLTVTYPLPSALGIFTQSGLEYRDNLGYTRLVHLDKIPEFLHNICAAEMPWTQASFATIFYDANQNPMPGLDLFEKVLQNNPAAFIDFQLMLLGKRSAQIQIARVGPEPHAMLCEDSRAFLDLSKKLSDEFKSFQEKATRSPVSRREVAVNKKLEDEFKIKWEGLIQPFAAKYKDEMDFHNIRLNLLTIASTVGLVGLVCKNMVRLYQGIHLGLFQFDAAYSKNVAVLEQLKTGNLPRPSLDLQNFFTQNRDDALHAIQELTGYTERLNQTITKCKLKLPESSFKQLHALHLWLSRGLSEFSENIVKIQGNENEVNQLDLFEALFINNWCESVRFFQTLEGDITHYPEELKAVVAEIHNVGELLSKELLNSEQYSIYARLKPEF